MNLIDTPSLLAPVSVYNVACMCVCMCVYASLPSILFFNKFIWASQVALVVMNLPATAGDTGDSSSILGLGRSPGEGNSNPFQYSCLGNIMDKGTLWATVHGVTESWTQLSN